MGEVQVVKGVASGLANPTHESPTARVTVFHHGNLWTGYARLGPEMDSGWHHHGDHDTYFYIISGTARLESGPGGRESAQLGPGDAAFVPAHTIHRELTGTEGLDSFVIRVGTGQLVFPTEGPG